MPLWQRGREDCPTRARALIHHCDAGSQPGFKGSSQHRLCGVIVDDGECLPSEGLAGPAVEGGGDGVEVVAAVFGPSVPRGRYWRSSPLDGPMFVKPLWPALQ
jgi:hypothetical protein